MKVIVDFDRIHGKRDPMIYGHFIEHFHRQVYEGIFDPGNKLSDKDGFRTDVIEALKKIKTPILRWPGGCFVSSYDWKNGVGKNRPAVFDKAWRVEEPNTFGTDEFIAFCKKVGCEPYICTNAGTGTAEEMSDWVEYCNLIDQGIHAKHRIENGNTEPFDVAYWSIGNENYGSWEIGAKSALEWGRLVNESAKMMLRVDPNLELSAAALNDLDWNIELLKQSGERLKWISIHEYWDKLAQENDLADYEQTMVFTNYLDDQVQIVRGLLQAMKLDGKIRISYDEWNLRGWHHPNVHTVEQGKNPESYLAPRDLNDDNSQYTMADAVFSACFLNMCLKNCDIIGMANFAPVVNTRGCIFTHKDGLVLRSTYFVFELFANQLEEIVLDALIKNELQMDVISKKGKTETVSTIDVVATRDENNNASLAIVNKDPQKSHSVEVVFRGGTIPRQYQLFSVIGDSPDAYNDVDHTGVGIKESSLEQYSEAKGITVPPHSVNIIKFYK
nr:alpha-L-arabinofuranosidase C-terminal domain-containing protein [uncultured Sphaerochaeta sp.]